MRTLYVVLDTLVKKTYSKRNQDETSTVQYIPGLLVISVPLA
jgi:hypothetical protein